MDTMTVETAVADSPPPFVDRQKVAAVFLSNTLLVILTVTLVAFTILFTHGQYQANRAIVEAGRAVAENAAGNGGQTDHNAINYLEAAQQAYGENNAINLISLVYTLSTTVILGYGAYLLRLGADDKEKLKNEILEMTSKEIWKKIKEPYDEFLDDSLRKAKNQYQELSDTSERKLKQQNDVYISITSCQNAAHTCLLLQSHIALLEQTTSENISQLSGIMSSDVMSRFHAYIIPSLSNFCGFLKDEISSIDREQMNILRDAWSLAKSSIDGYIQPGENGFPSPLERAGFGEEDQQTIKNLYDEIDREMRRLRRSLESRRN